MNLKYVTDMQFWIAWIIVALVVGFIVRLVMK